MLNLALTLLGGYVQQAADSYEPQELFFYCHSVHPESNINSSRTYDIPTTADQLSQEQHHGLYIAENIRKDTQRSSFVSWGILSAQRQYGKANTLCLSPCAKLFNSSMSPVNAAYINCSASGGTIGGDPPLYKSGGGTTSPRLCVNLEGGILRVTDSFSGEEKSTTAILPPRLQHSENEGITVYYLGVQPAYNHHFVVSSYHNESLGIRQLTLPLRSAGGTQAAIFEHEMKKFIQL